MIRIGKAIIEILKANATITGIVKKSIFPIVAPEDQAMPFIVFKRNNVTPDYAKDGLAADKGQVQIDIVTADYTQGITLAQAVRDSLELKRGLYAGIVIDSSRLVLASESADANAYIQELIFHITVK